MAENIKFDENPEEVARIVGHNQKNEPMREDRKIIKDKKQYSVRIPSLFAKKAKIDAEKDCFEFALMPLGEDENTEFTIEARLKRG
jgi:hypothetical protein